jgi:V8-like Glu-specific endopeptidase
MVTEKGDSGTPLIVQPEGMVGFFAMIGLHCSGKYSSGCYKFNDEKNKAVRITESLVEQLSQWEKKLKNIPVSSLKFKSIFFEKIKRRP